jgi:hypothetical protein
MASPQLRKDRMKLLQTPPWHRSVAAAVGSTSTHWKGARKGRWQAPHQHRACSRMAGTLFANVWIRWEVHRWLSTSSPCLHHWNPGLVEAISGSFNGGRCRFDGRDVICKRLDSMRGPQCKISHDPGIPNEWPPFNESMGTRHARRTGSFAIKLGTFVCPLAAPTLLVIHRPYQ